jgi:hypothetical protein
MSGYSYTRIRQARFVVYGSAKLAAHDHPPETMCLELGAVTDQRSNASVSTSYDFAQIAFGCRSGTIVAFPAKHQKHFSRSAAW